MDNQVIIAVLGTASGIVSAYYAYLQHQKSRNTNMSDTPTTSLPKEAKLWSTAIDKAIENFRKTRKDCHIEIAQQKNFERHMDRFSTSELILHVKYSDDDNGGAARDTYRFDLKINKDGDILEIESKGKRSTDKEKFR